MKILTINETVFKLPDDFSGRVPEALRALADYLEADTPPLTGEPAVDRKPLPINDGAWDDFQDTVARGGRLSGEMTYQVLEKDGWEVKHDPSKEIKNEVQSNS